MLSQLSNLIGLCLRLLLGAPETTINLMGCAYMAHRNIHTTQVICSAALLVYNWSSSIEWYLSLATNNDVNFDKMV